MSVAREVAVRRVERQSVLKPRMIAESAKAESPHPSVRQALSLRNAKRDLVSARYPGLGLRVSLLLLLGLGIRCSGPTSPELVPGWIETEWTIAQEKLSSPEWVGSQAWRIPPESVSYVAKPDTFWCDGMEVNGCYSSERRILYNEKTPNVIRHEAGHAILHQLGDPRWQCYEHESECAEAGQ